MLHLIGVRLWVGMIGSFAFLNGQIDFLEDISHEVEKIIIVVIGLIDHEVYHPHDLLRVISIRRVSKSNARTSHQIELDTALVVNLRQDTAQRDVRGLYFSLRVLFTEEIEHIYRFFVDN